MKGKKFTAAEKHFMKKEDKYNKEIKRLDSIIDDLRSDLKETINERTRLENENHELRVQLKYLLDKNGLTREDIKVAIERDREGAKAMAIFNGFVERDREGAKAMAIFNGFVGRYM